MKRLSFIPVLFIVILLFTTIGNQQAYAQLITKEQLIDSFTRMSDYFLSVAEAMPPGEYGFKPTSEMMSFADQMNHVARSMYFVGTILKKPIQKEITGTTKEQVISNLKGSFEYAKNALKDFNMKDFEEQMDWGQGNKRSRFLAYLFVVDHMTHHKGYCLVYLRLKGITPPQYVGW